MSEQTDPSERHAASNDRWERAANLIPGGSQLLSKRPEIFAPDSWPAYYEQADGVAVQDIDGNEYIDMSLMGVGPCVLGYGDEDVDAAAKRSIDQGMMATLNPPEEVDLAEKILSLNPWAEMVRFGRAGGEAVAIAVRLARAATGNETVAFCGYHGWHDWYLAANLTDEENLEEHLLPGLEAKGVPKSLRGTAKPFYYNDFGTLEQIANRNELAAIIMEPIRHETPENNFLQRVRELATETNTPLIFDEITAGFRVNVGGVHQKFDVTPDAAVYGKAIANGYPMAAVVGRESIMDEAQETFVSSTFWTERVGPTAALATIDKMEREDVPEHLIHIGEQVTTGWERLADKHNIALETTGLAPWTRFELEYENSQAVRTLFTQEMLQHGFLAFNSMYTSYAHTEDHVEAYLKAVDDVFSTLSDHIESETVEAVLKSETAQSKFERLN